MRSSPGFVSIMICIGFSFFGKVNRCIIVFLRSLINLIITLEFSLYSFKNDPYGNVFFSWVILFFGSVTYDTNFSNVGFATFSLNSVFLKFLLLLLRADVYANLAAFDALSIGIVYV